MYLKDTCKALRIRWTKYWPLFCLGLYLFCLGLWRVHPTARTPANQMVQHQNNCQPRYQVLHLETRPSLPPWQAWFNGFDVWPPFVQQISGHLGQMSNVKLDEVFKRLKNDSFTCTALCFPCEFWLPSRLKEELYGYWIEVWTNSNFIRHPTFDFNYVLWTLSTMLKDLFNRT